MAEVGFNVPEPRFVLDGQWVSHYLILLTSVRANTIEIVNIEVTSEVRHWRVDLIWITHIIVGEVIDENLLEMLISSRWSRGYLLHSVIWTSFFACEFTTHEAIDTTKERSLSWNS